jgi:hypothetical protein
MRSKNIICLLFVSLLLAQARLLAKDPREPRLRIGGAKENLPEGFKLLAALPEMDDSVNMTEYIRGFYGPEELAANTSVGIYQWGKRDSYDRSL